MDLSTLDPSVKLSMLNEIRGKVITNQEISRDELFLGMRLLQSLRIDRAGARGGSAAKKTEAKRTATVLGLDSF